MIKPLSNYVIVTETPAGEKIGSLYVPGTASKEPIIRARVLSVGPGRISDEGVRLPMTVKPGETVVFQARRGQKQEIDGEDVIIVPETDLLAVVE